MGLLAHDDPMQALLPDNPPGPERAQPDARQNPSLLLQRFSASRELYKKIMHPPLRTLLFDARSPYVKSIESTAAATLTPRTD
jgi:hypothetical protein